MADAVVDASVWVSCLFAGDARHRPSLRWLNREGEHESRLLGPSLVVAEVAGAIVRRTGDAARARRAASLLLRMPTVRLASLDDALAREAAELAARLRLRGADAVYVAVARSLAVPLVTWDTEQRERAADVIAVRMPE